ncbi:MAG TPA: winged helix-turn-helix domain-containing protein [Terriglobales bacterium]|nr:winged helix-turn-helix domain-containing protein [Terriglobales bacterium]
MSVNSSSSIVRFGTFELELQTGELRHAGQKVKLQEQPFQVLAALLENPGKIVTREELRSKLWPEDTFVDFDHSLNAAIKRLRDALGESADAPVFIETLARRGYRFIAPVNGSSATSEIAIAGSPARSKSSFLRIAVAFLSLIAIGVLVWAVWRLPVRRTGIIERKLTSNSSENGVISAGISPDGKFLAYTDTKGIYLKQLRTGETHPVPLPPNFSVQVDDWFPDCSHLLVSRKDQRGRPALWSISVFGGSPRQLANDALGGSVSPDGLHIAFRRVEVAYGGLLGREQWIMRSDGTDPIKVAADKGSGVGTPTWSPDGKRIAYVRTALAYNALTGSVEVNEWESASAQTLFSDSGLTPALHWLPDGRLMYALNAQRTSGPGDSGVWTVSLPQAGKISDPPKRITQGNGSITQVTGSADGKALVFVRENWSPSIYIGALTADGTTLLAHRRLTLDESASIPTSWTPDSAAVLFYSDRNGTFEIFKQAIDQPLAESLASAADQQLSQPRVTPDGSDILYVATPKSAGPEAPSSLFAIPVAGGAPRSVLKDVAIFAVECARSPSTICLYSVTKGNTRETFPFDVRSGKITGPPQIDPEGFWSLSPDGSQRAIVAVGSNQGTIQLRSVSSGKTRDMAVKGWNGLMHIDWSSDGRSLLVGWHHESDSALLKVSLDGNVSVLLRSSNFIGYAIPSPDGRLLAILEVSPSKNVWQIEDF